MPGGYDEQTEHRRLREREEKPGYAQWLDYVFFTGGEMLGLSIPAILAAIYVPVASNVVQSAQLLALAVGVALAATIRCEWVDVGHPWPAVSARTVLARAGWYPAVMILGPFTAPRVWEASGSVVPAVGVALATGIVLAAGVPWLGDVLEE